MARTATAREIPPPLELECLKSLWLLGEGHVRDVQQVLAERRTLAYTTVMTILERLVRKGAVTRRKLGRAFLYAPALSQETVTRAAVRRLVDSFFGGSEEDLIAYLRGQRSAPELPERAREVSLDTALL